MCRVGWYFLHSVGLELDGLDSDCVSVIFWLDRVMVGWQLS